MIQEQHTGTISFLDRLLNGIHMPFRGLCILFHDSPPYSPINFEMISFMICEVPPPMVMSRVSR